MDDKNIQLIKKIIDYAEKILSYCSTLSEDTFLANDMLTEACVFNIIQIGEATRKLSDDFTAKYSNIPWGKICGLRNRIVHDYDGINFPLIWNIICNDLLDLIQQLNKIVGNSNETYK